MEEGGDRKDRKTIRVTEKEIHRNVSRKVLRVVKKQTRKQGVRQGRTVRQECKQAVVRRLDRIIYTSS